MTKTGFITVEIPVNYEKGPDGWYAWAKVDVFGSDAATEKKAIELLQEKVEKSTKNMKRIVKRREAQG